MTIQCGKPFTYSQTETISEKDALGAVQKATTAAMINGLAWAATQCAALDDNTTEKCDHVRAIAPISVTITCAATTVTVIENGQPQQVAGVSAEAIFEGTYCCYKKKKLPAGDAQCFDPSSCGKVFTVDINVSDPGANLDAAQERAGRAATAVCARMQTCTKAVLAGGPIAKANGKGWVFKFKCETPPVG